MSPTMGQSKLVGAARWFAFTSVEVASKVAAAKTVIFEDLFFIISSCICVEWYSLGRPERDHSSIRATGKEIDKIASAIGLGASLTDNSTASQARRFCDQH